MANLEHLKILERGVDVWNQWLIENPTAEPNLENAVLVGKELSGVNFSNCQLAAAVLAESNLSNADLDGVLMGYASLIEANLTNVLLSNSWLISVDFSSANLSGASLTGAEIGYANFHNARLTNTDFGYAEIYGVSFNNTDLSVAKGLESIVHLAPSSIGVDTLYLSSGNIPESFLRGCGVPDDFITFIPSHFGIQQAIQFYSCFISYSTKDEEFARRLYSRMRDEHLRVWFAPEDVKGGEKLYEQIERAIQLHDRLLLVLSESSLQSKWVMTEIRRARKVELRENRRKLFPIRLVGYDALQTWECFDADTGEDLAAEVRQYFIPDFSNWKDHDSFEPAFDRLLRDLRAEEKKV